MSMSINNDTGEIQWTWRDRVPFFILAAVVFAVFMGALTACGPKPESNVPNPVANTAPVAPVAPVERTTGQRICDDSRLNTAARAVCADALNIPPYWWTGKNGEERDDPGGVVDVAQTMTDTNISTEELPFVLQAIIDAYNEYGPLIPV